MRSRGLVLLAAVVAACAVGVVAAWAGAPNILRFSAPQLVYDSGADATSLALVAKSATSSSDAFSDPRIVVQEIVVAGIKEGVETSLTADYEAVYVCVNSGGNVPNAANKVTLVGELETSAAFPAVKNGKATGSLLTQPLPSAAEAAEATGFTCPSGQVLEFDHVVFFGLVLSVAGGETILLEDTFVSESVHGLN